MTETLAYGYSSASTQRELSNEYHNDVKMVFKNLCMHVLWMKLASALKGLRIPPGSVIRNYDTFDHNFDIENDFRQNI